MLHNEYPILFSAFIFQERFAKLKKALIFAASLTKKVNTIP